MPFLPPNQQRQSTEGNCLCMAVTCIIYVQCVCNRMTEYVDHLHEHFVEPVVVTDGCYQVPQVRLRSTNSSALYVDRPLVLQNVM